MAEETGRVTLLEYRETVLERDRDVGIGFPGWLEGEEIHVRAVLERTVVFEAPGDPDRRLAPIERVMVDPKEVPLVTVKFSARAAAAERGRRGSALAAKRQREFFNRKGGPD